MNYYDLGYSKFLTKSVVSDNPTTDTSGTTSSVSSISSSDLSVQLNPVTDIVFSSIDYETVDWTSGTIYFSNGSNSGYITTSGGLTDLSPKTYIYFDGDKPGQLLWDKDIKNVFGGRKILLAIVEPGAVGKSCKITPIITTGYTGNIVAENINVTQLDAVAANTGTLTVDESITAGGSSNGIIYVKDSSNVTKVQLDNTGITVNEGKIIIKNSSDTSILDATGLISTANFVSDSIVNTAARTYSNSATYADIADTSITTASLARTTKVLIIYTLNVVEFPINGTTAFAGKVTLRIDSTDQVDNNFELELTSLSSIADTSAWGGPLTASGVVSLTSGTHTLKLRAQTINTNSQLNVETTSLAYIVLGS
ncbi:MAG: hypothetical protein WC479_03030 [Candidatus Izemoplasmatales bacterium]